MCSQNPAAFDLLPYVSASAGVIRLAKPREPDGRGGRSTVCAMPRSATTVAQSLDFFRSSQGHWCEGAGISKLFPEAESLMPWAVMVRKPVGEVLVMPAAVVLSPIWSHEVIFCAKKRGNSTRPPCLAESQRPRLPGRS